MDRICHEWNVRYDESRNLVGADRRVLGCADFKRNRIVVRNNAETVYHELRHIWDEHCK